MSEFRVRVKRVPHTGEFEVQVTNNGSQWWSIGVTFMVEANAKEVAYCIANYKAQEEGDPNIAVEIAA